MNALDTESFEKRINYTFNDKDKIKLAFTHSSYANEHKNFVSENNERLEFLGDAVLDMIVSEYIYKKFPKMPEGELTKLRAGVVCEGSLAKIAREFEFGKYLLLGKGEESTGGRNRDSILADAFEVVIGVICLDGGIESAGKYIMSFMEKVIDDMKISFRTLDCKTHLQELIQKNSKSPITYEIIDEKGPDHDKVFIAEVYHDKKTLGCGEGKSKKEAEQNAAFDALEKLENNNWYTAVF